MVNEPRLEENKLYPFEEIVLVLCSCAAVSGAEGGKDIAKFGRIKLDWLRQFRTYVNRMPPEDGIGWVMARRSPRALGEFFGAWIRSIARIADSGVVAIDGETLRQFSLNLPKRSMPAMSVRQKKYRAGLDDDFRAKILFER